MPMEDWLNECKQLPVAEKTRRHLLRRYGRQGPALVAQVAADPQLGRPIHEDRPEVMVEVDHAVQFEMAHALSDFMWRRTFLAFTVDQGQSAVPRVLSRMADRLGWDAPEQRRQHERYESEVERAIAPLRAALQQPAAVTAKTHF